MSRPVTGARLVLAFDYGLKYIGVATGQQITATATALTTVRARDGVPDWNEVAHLLEEWQPARLLVGLPLNMDDSESDMSQRARRFGRRLHGRFGLPVAMVDERLTSRAVRGALAGGRHDPASHALAAQLIARTWLADQALRAADSAPVNDSRRS